MDRFLAHIEWNNILCENISDLYSNFLLHCNNCISSFVPVISVSKKFLPPHIISLKKYREKLWKNIQFANVKAKFDATTKKIDKETLFYFQNVEKRLLSRKSPKQIFAYVSSHLKETSAHIPTIVEQNKAITSNEEKANLFADYFSSVFLPAFASTPLSPNTPVEHGLGFFEIDDYSVFQMLKNLPSKQNTSPDSIPFVFLKKCALTLSKPIGCLFRHAMMTGSVPAQWKTAIVVPLHKKAEKNLKENYRPISLTCSLSRIFEKILAEKLGQFFETNNIIPPFQHGFRKKMSITTQLIETLNDWSLYLEEGYCIDVIYFDIAKAFDTVNHHLLLLKLRNAGVYGSVFNLINDFLSQRTFSVKVGDSLSSARPASSGVPQGSVIGPLLFLFYISDIANIPLPSSIKLKMFADDLKVYLAYKDPADKFQLQQFVDNFSDWCVRNELKIAPSKCTALYLGKNNSRMTYSLDGTPIGHVEKNVRDLGILVQPSLTWTDHIELCAKNASLKMFMLFKAIRSNSTRFLLHMYKCFVRPSVEFSTPIFNPYLKKHIVKLEKVQQKAVSIIFYRCLKNKYGDKPSYVDLLKILGLETLEIRRLKNDLLLLQKTILQEVSISPSILPPLTNPRTRSQNYRLPLCKTNTRHHFWLNRSIKVYNSLPNEIKSCSTLNNFRDKLGKFDFSPFLKL